MTGAEDDVRSILDACVAATPAIRRELCRGAELTSTENASGDAQLAADVRVDDLLEERLAPLSAIGAYASEERADVLDVGSGYSVAVDPLDGSSNLRSNNLVGTVVGVYDAPLPAPGRRLVASAVLCYGPATTMTAAVDGSVTRYTIEDGDVVSADSVSFPETSRICGFVGPTDEWTPALRDYWQHLRRDHKLRYTGAMVGDIAHLLDLGGLLGYPSLSSDPDGVLRLQYESNPVAHVVETAGGRTSTGRGSILDAEPKGLHQRIPSYFGNAGPIERLESRSIDG